MYRAGIYILTHRASGKQYIGKDVQLPRRLKHHFFGNYHTAPLLQDAIRTFGIDAFDIQLIPYPGISEKALRAVEQWKIKQHNTLHPNGYNIRNAIRLTRKAYDKKRPHTKIHPHTEFIETAWEMRRRGKGLQEISDELGFSTNTISKWCQDVKAPPKNADNIAKARKLEKQGIKRKEIAAELGVHPKTIRRWLGKKFPKFTLQTN